MCLPTSTCRPNRAKDVAVILHFIRDAGGAAAIEYVMFGCLLFVSLFAVVECVNGIAKSSFSDAAGALHSSGTVERTTANHEHVIVKQSSMAKAPASSLALRIGMAICAVAAAALAWAVLFRRHKAPRTNEGDNEIAADLSDAKVENFAFHKRHQLLRIFAANCGDVLGSRIEVRHMMSKGLVSVSENTPADEVAELMRTKRIRHLLVCRKEQLIGIISDRDLKRSGAKTAAQLMTRNPIVVSPKMLLSPAVTLLIERHISCLPVVEDGKICGLITTTDILLAFQCTLQVLQKIASVEGIATAG